MKVIGDSSSSSETDSPFEKFLRKFKKKPVDVSCSITENSSFYTANYIALP
jgi:hypothetical protein